MLTHFLADGQKVRPEWVDDFKGNSGTSQTTAIAVDPQNNVYITGYFFGTVDFDPGSGVKNLTSLGQSDIFVGKYKSDGTLIWAESFGGANAENPYGIAVDKDGNITIAGVYFSLMFDADPGPGTYILHNFSVNNNNGFLVHLNTNGAFLWAHSVEANAGNAGTGGFYYGTCADSQDNVLATTTVPALGTVGDSTYNLPSSLLVKYSPAGNVLWALDITQLPSAITGSANIQNIAIDQQDNIITTGSLRGKVNFNPLGIPDSLTAANQTFAFYVAKYNPAGLFIWGNTITSPPLANYSPTNVVCTDQQNNIYFNNTFYPSLTFGSTVLNVGGNGTNECIAKYSPNGVLQFAEAVGAPSNTGVSQVIPGNFISTGKNSNIYLSGNINGSVNFDPTQASTGIITAKGYQDFYIAEYNSLGKYHYAFSVGRANCANAYASNIAVDSNNYINIGGSFCSTTNFDPTGCSTTNETATSPADPFLAQYVSDALAANIITQPTVSSFCTNGTPGAITGSLPTGGSGSYTYQWLSSADSVTFVDINGATAQNYTPPTITATTYYERIVSSDTCTVPTVSNIIGLHVLPALAAPVVTVASTTSSSIIFTWSAVPGASGYQISTNGGQTSTTVHALADTITNLQPGQSVTISVQAGGIIPCQLSAAATAKGSIAATDIVFVANAFTPNGDGRDDILHVKGDNIQSLKFSIYDQWGELLFTSTSQQNGWDGTYKGAKEPVGVYVYSLQAIMNDGSNINKKGTITLLK